MSLEGLLLVRSRLSERQLVTELSPHDFLLKNRASHVRPLNVTFKDSLCVTNRLSKYTIIQWVTDHEWVIFFCVWGYVQPRETTLYVAWMPATSGSISLSLFFFFDLIEQSAVAAKGEEKEKDRVKKKYRFWERTVGDARREKNNIKRGNDK